MSWYRQYRPQTVAALHITPVRDAFGRILEQGEFMHAYLLTGPKGTGKTSGARILAKILNCEVNRQVVEGLLKNSGKKSAKAKLQEPCNLCATCVAITSGTSFCVLEMDGASNRGIDDIRELTAKVGLSPGDGLINVVIIDEVHMLTTEAFNALLKVLEEPPAHVVFILATTDVQKMPATVLSRCQVIQYRKADPSEIEKSLRGIAESEGITLDQESLSALVAVADGSFRDGVKIFEQIAKGKSRVTLTDVEMVLGKSVREIAEKLLQGLAKRNVSEVGTLLLQVMSEGVDLLVLQREVLRSLHERMLSSFVTKNPHLPTYVALLKALNVSSTQVLPISGIPFEIACLEWCLVKTSNQVGKKKARLIVETPEATTEFPDVPVEYSHIINRWHEVLLAVREKNPSLEALLKTTKPQSVTNNTLNLEVFYKFHKEQLELERNYTVIREVLSHLFASRVKPVFVLSEKAAIAADLPESNISGVVDLNLVKAVEDAFLS